jgi:MFS family permease
VPDREPLLTPRFLLIVASGLAYFLALGMLLPVVPLYAKRNLGAGDAIVGVVVGSLFVSAVLLRPYLGRLGDRHGRRMLMVGGALMVAVSIALYGLVEAVPWLIGARVLTGVGEAAFFVGAATMITDLAPLSRRGEGLSYWSVAIYGGLAFGPPLGEWVLGDDRYTLTWLVAAAFGVLAVALALCTSEVRQPDGPPPSGPIVNRSALRPGTVLFLGLIGLAGFSAFVRLHAEDLDLSGAGGVFLFYGAIVLCVRIGGAKLPDQLGARRAGTVALVGAALGMAIMAVWPSVVGLFVGTAVFAVGMSLLYPALLVLALSRAPDSERASVVGTFSSFFDLSQALGALLLGGVAELGGYRSAFAVAGAAALAGLAVLWTTSGQRLRHVDPEAVPA